MSFKYLISAGVRKSACLAMCALVATGSALAAGPIIATPFIPAMSKHALAPARAVEPTPAELLRMVGAGASGSSNDKQVLRVCDEQEEGPFDKAANGSFGEHTYSDGAGNVTISPTHSFAISPPKGWSESSNAALSHFYLSVKSLQEMKPLVFYVRSVPKDSTTPAVLDAAGMRDRDVTEMRRAWPDMASQPVAPTRMKGGVSAPTYSFRYGDYHEHVVYVDHGTNMVMLVVSAASQKQLHKALPAFRKFVMSYQWLPQLEEAVRSVAADAAAANSAASKTEQ